MKSLLLIGGFLGFGIGMLFSWAEKSAWPACLWHACMAAYLTGMMMRWWGGAWRRNLEASFHERPQPTTAQTPFTISKATKS